MRDASSRLLPATAAAAAGAAHRALEAAAALDVLSARTIEEAEERALAAARRSLKVGSTDVALRLIARKLEEAWQEQRTIALDDLLKVVGLLDPDGEKRAAGTAVAVEVVIRQERAGGEG